jgi:hypothetical protein
MKTPPVRVREHLGGNLRLARKGHPYRVEQGCHDNLGAGTERSPREVAKRRGASLAWRAATSRAFAMTTRRDV